MKETLTVRKIAVTGIMSGLSAVLMYLEFSIALVPSFLKYDFSDLPAVITSFALGPVYGIIVELIKNLIHLPATGTSGVGELANFLIGATFVGVAGVIYKYRKTKPGAVIGAAAGTVAMAALSVPVNYFVTYPVYSKFIPMDAIISMYQAICPAADTLIKALLIFNVPFTMVKGLINVLITLLVYKKLSPLLKGDKKTTVKEENQNSD